MTSSLRVAAEGDGDQQLLLHAAGEATKGRARIGATSRPEAPGDSAWMRWRSEPHTAAAKLDQLADRHLQRRRQLRHETDLAEHLRALRGAGEAVDGDLALDGVLAEQAADQRRLAGAVRADQRDALAEPDLEVDAVEHAVLALEGLADVCRSGSSGATLFRAACSRPLTSKTSEPVGQTSTHRPQRVQSGPIGTSVMSRRGP
jgi:hypothetical protein